MASCVAPGCAGKVEHRLIDILVIAVCAVIACAESCQAADQRYLAGDAVKLLAQAGRRGDQEGLQRQHGLRAHIVGKMGTHATKISQFFILALSSLIQLTYSRK
jgi:hypothetical protein